MEYGVSPLGSVEHCLGDIMGGFESHWEETVFLLGVTSLPSSTLGYRVSTLVKFMAPAQEPLISL